MNLPEPHYGMSHVLEPNRLRDRARLTAAALETIWRVIYSPAAQHLALLVSVEFYEELSRLTDFSAGGQQLDRFGSMPCRVERHLPEGWPFALVPREVLAAILPR